MQQNKLTYSLSIKGGYLGLYEVNQIASPLPSIETEQKKRNQFALKIVTYVAEKLHVADVVTGCHKGHRYSIASR